ncbi:MAG TPA: VOC family protein [Baekduia sp.]|uniref:VOC family protein n=1 Tax=Baekduia sp. TaxID=2600305 RepID=UPI002CCBEAB5|nr:VOC family protein [Baekduia sp.]HMJ37650.1 VOC family protein [Baekduia sp.]
MSSVIPTFRYPDARAGIDFLCSAFGFTEHAAHEQDGIIVHAELRLGDDWVMLGQDRDDGGKYPTGPTTTYVIIDDPDAHYARAVAAGAEITSELTNQDYGSRDYAAKDPAGNVWSFGTYRPA